MQKIRNHGRNAKGHVEQWGTNSRLDNVQVAVLNYNLTKVEQTIKKRITLAKLYFELLRNNKNIKFTHTRNSSFVRHTFQNFEILVKKEINSKIFKRKWH